MKASEKLSRRKVLRGMLNGAAITVGIPVLECFLNTNGNAYAATGQQLPPCFGTWFWALGLALNQWTPTEAGNTYKLPPHLASLEPIKAKMNLYSGMQTFLDGKANQNHYSGAQCQMTGIVSKNGSDYSTSLDVTVGNLIVKRPTRFRSIEVSLDGGRDASWSARGANGLNPAEISPLALYQRLFGADFRDPNAAEFKPDPIVMLRRSVLSSVTEQRQALMKEVSAADKARLDEYYTSIRDLEQQMAVQLEKPVPLPSCSIPPKIEEDVKGRTTADTAVLHKQFATLVAHALSCGQTRVFNFSTGSAFSRLLLPDDPTTYHVLTHDEPVDPQTGYQPKCKRLAEASMGYWLDLVQTLDSIKEGEGTLLDRTVVFAFTDHGEARLHSMKHYPMFTAGSGGGRMKTGYHIHAEGDTVTRVGFTIQQAFGVAASSWGSESNQTSRPFTEVLAT
jgi:Protein of unknown function (DUF1552)